MNNAYWKSHRQGMANAFKEAKKHLWDGIEIKPVNKASYICHALIETDNPFQWAAKKIVMERLAGHSSLVNWLITNGVVPSKITLRRAQMHRHQWLDQLIEEFSNPPVRTRQRSKRK